MDIGNRYKNLVKIPRVVPGISSGTDRQTDGHTYIRITILRNRSRGRSNQAYSEYKHSLTFRVRRYMNLQCIRS